MPTVQEHRARLERAKRKKPQEVTVEICVEPALARALEELKSTGGTKAEIAELQQQVDEAYTPFTMRSIGRLRFDALMREHPPTDEQNAEHQKEFNEPAGYNVDTFSVALVASSMIASVLNPLQCTDEEWDDLFNETVVEVQRWADEWNPLEFVPLWTTALAANTASHTRQVGKAYG